VCLYPWKKNQVMMRGGLKNDDGLPCTLPTIKAKFLLGEGVITAAADAVAAA